MLFSPLFAEDVQFDYFFSDGLKPPTRLVSGRTFVPKKHVQLGERFAKKIPRPLKRLTGQPTPPKVTSLRNKELK